MNRLTKRNNDGSVYLPRCFEKCDGAPMDCLNCEEDDAITDRLAAYEDTGLEPEEIRHMADIFDEYVRATEEGRLVVLPCKIGDTVYWVHGRSVLPVHILWFETNAYGWCACGTYPPMATPTFKFEDFGKTVFLTRQDAEAELRKEKGDGRNMQMDGRQ